MIIREAQETDIPAIQALAQAMNLDEAILKRSFSQKKLAKSLASDNITILVAEIEDEIRGLCQFGIPLLEDCDCEDLIEIQRLFVHLDDSLDDIGEALIDETEEWLNQDADILRLSVFVNPDDAKMIRFFAAMGFHHEASEDLDEQWYMETEL